MSSIMSSQLTEPTMIGTMCRTSLMDLPAEIRIKIFEGLLAFPDEIMVPATKLPGKTLDSSDSNRHPIVGILQTCKLINIEATPIFYSINKFVVSLPLERPSQQKESTSIPRKPTFQLSYFRWSTLAQIKSLSFISGNNVAFTDEPGSRADLEGLPRAPITLPPARPFFECNGMDILARFSVSDRQYSPGGPDEYMSLSLSNWVSMKVMRAELNAFQKELEIMMRAVPPVAAAPQQVQPIHVPVSLVQNLDLLAQVDQRTEVAELGAQLAAHDPNHPLLGGGHDVGSDISPSAVD